MSDAPTGVPAHRSFRGYSCNGGRGVALEAGMSWYFRSAGSVGRAGQDRDRGGRAMCDRG